MQDIFLAIFQIKWRLHIHTDIYINTCKLFSVGWPCLFLHLAVYAINRTEHLELAAVTNVLLSRATGRYAACSVPCAQNGLYS